MKFHFSPLPYFYCFGLLLLVTGCSTGEEQIRTTVLTYTNSVARLYAENDSAGLEAVASLEQVNLLREQLRKFQLQQILPEPVLRSIRFERIGPLTDGLVNVLAQESWDFRYVSSNGSRELRRVSLDCIVRYALERAGEKWFVTKTAVQAVDGNDNKIPDPFDKLPADLVPPAVALSTDELLKNSVLAYLKLLAEGYKKQDMTPLSDSATKKRAMKAYYHMSSMGEGQVRMEPRLQAIEIVDVKLSGLEKELSGLEKGLSGLEKGVVKTEERWNYVYYSTQSGDRVYKNTAAYKMTYILIRGASGRWLVDDIVIEQAQEGKGEGQLPFVTRPHAQPAGGGAGMNNEKLKVESEK